MKKKLFAALLFFAGVTTSLLWISCNSGKGPSTTKIVCPPFDTAKYKVVYKKDGYVLLHSLEDSVGFTDKKSAPIKDDIATRMIRYYIKRPQSAKYPIVIDFDYTSIAYLMTKLDDINMREHEKKSLRIYLSAYDKAAVDSLYTGVPATERGKFVNYMTAVLVGRYDGAEVTEAVNLGNICPPNCPDNSTIPDPNKSRLYRKATTRTDIYP